MQVGNLTFQWVAADNVDIRVANGWSVASPTDHGVVIASDIADAVSSGAFVLMCKAADVVEAERAAEIAQSRQHLAHFPLRSRADVEWARAGETMFCRNGHEICDVTEDFRPGAPDWLEKVSNWRQPALLKWELGQWGNVDERLNQGFCCAQCEAPLSRPHLQRFYRGQDAWLAAEKWSSATLVAQADTWDEK